MLDQFDHHRSVRRVEVRVGTHEHPPATIVADHLVDRGLLRVVHGRGMFAPALPIDYRIGRDTQFGANLAAQDLAPNQRVLGTTVGEATGWMAEQLGVPEGASLTVVETLGYADDVPLVIASMHLPQSRFPGVQGHMASFTTFTALFARYGLSDYLRKITLYPGADAGRSRGTAVASTDRRAAARDRSCGRRLHWRPDHLFRGQVGGGAGSVEHRRMTSASRADQLRGQQVARRI